MTQSAGTGTLMNLSVIQSNWNLEKLALGGQYQFTTGIAFGFEHYRGDPNVIEGKLNVRLEFFPQEDTEKTSIAGNINITTQSLFKVDDDFQDLVISDPKLNYLVRQSNLILSGFTRGKILEIARGAGLMAPLLLQFDALEGTFINQGGFVSFDEIPGAQVVPVESDDSTPEKAE